MIESTNSMFELFDCRGPVGNTKGLWKQIVDGKQARVGGFDETQNWSIIRPSSACRTSYIVLLCSKRMHTERFNDLVSDLCKFGSWCDLNEIIFFFVGVFYLFLLSRWFQRTVKKIVKYLWNWNLFILQKCGHNYN